ncbi:hypothetical protein GHK86_06040 [Acidimicrobiaceae bacterium USS-CC1]|uniref:Twin-arginine translocation signal domain-containing protein n=1 Tax=Acidiferrimicrobium australe TaxID=2664430 RepID=A0ABW9QR28_9ACTN|nr:hypothetical protein [Acidiferrimicrobium australe]
MHDGDVHEAGDVRPGLTRRRVLQGAVVAGGAVWAAPVVESFVTAAAAASAPALPFSYILSAQQVSSTDTGIPQLTVNVSFTNTSSFTEQVAFAGHVQYGTTTKALGLIAVDVAAHSAMPTIAKTYVLTGATSGEQVTVKLTITVQPLATGQSKSHVTVSKTIQLS